MRTIIFALQQNLQTETLPLLLAKVATDEGVATEVQLPEESVILKLGKTTLLDWFDPHL